MGAFIAFQFHSGEQGFAAISFLLISRKEKSWPISTPGIVGQFDSVPSIPHVGNLS